MSKYSIITNNNIGLSKSVVYILNLGYAEGGISNFGSTTKTMVGLGIYFTPIKTGYFKISFYGSAYATNPAIGYLEIRYGTGTAPSQGDAITGNSALRSMSFVETPTPFVLVGYAPVTKIKQFYNGASVYSTVGENVNIPNTKYWIDLAVQINVSGSNLVLAPDRIEIEELLAPVEIHVPPPPPE